ncbi:hypothetical protein OU790_14035, partial [Ruegeria sp. NA]
MSRFAAVKDNFRNFFTDRNQESCDAVFFATWQDQNRNERSLSGRRSNPAAVCVPDQVGPRGDEHMGEKS